MDHAIITPLSMIVAGTRLGPYQIVSRVGSGGMGEVWRARDTRLEREVAIKILPENFAHDAQLRLRFEREAKTVSQLNHPHICVVHDVGEATIAPSASPGSAAAASPAAVPYLVMELLDGETLAARIERGPLTLAEVLRYGAQIADALDRAHRAGIIHRDLKPANVMLTRSGAKLLDFGLARSGSVIAPVPRGDARALAEEGATDLRSSEPLTQEGTILGTFQYMAPEQLEGTTADQRTDIFALGAVLYEMASGQKAFEARSKTSLIAQIVGAEPRALREIQPLTPPGLEHVIAGCLKKEPDERWQSAHDVAKELRWIAETGSAAGIAAPLAARRRLRERLAWSLAAAALLVAVVAAALPSRSGRELPIPVRFEIAPPERLGFSGNSIALSPDGRHLAVQLQLRSGETKLFLRSLDQPSMRPLEGTEGGTKPFWSPDGREIAYFTDTRLMRISLAGGAPQTICEASYGVGGSWGADGTIVFASEWGKPLVRVAASGGEPQPITQLKSNEVVHAWPHFLPDGRRFIFLARHKPGVRATVLLGSIDSNETRELFAADAIGGIVAEHILYLRESVLFAQPFDLKTMSPAGQPLKLADRVDFSNDWAAGPVAASSGRVLAWIPHRSRSRRLQWLDREGQLLGTVGSASAWQTVALSPDGRRVAASRLDPARGSSDLWLLELERNVETRLTSGPSSERRPVWSPDGRSLAFHGDYESGMYDYYEVPAGGAGKETLVHHTGNDLVPTDWSPDGRLLLAHQTVEGRRQVYTIERAEPGSKPEVKPLISARTSSDHARFSPDGRWVVFKSFDSGRAEVYVEAFPSTGERWQISTSGGDMPVWRGNEVFFISGERAMVSVRVEPSEGGLRIGQPQTLFRMPESGEVDFAFDVTPDGKGLLVITEDESEPAPSIHVAFPWLLNAVQ